jgi:hypothetical protein
VVEEMLAFSRDFNSWLLSLIEELHLYTFLSLLS